jgi:hypothetical protein
VSRTETIAGQLFSSTDMTATIRARFHPRIGRSGGYFSNRRGQSSFLMTLQRTTWSTWAGRSIVQSWSSGSHVIAVGQCKHINLPANNLHTDTISDATYKKFGNKDLLGSSANISKVGRISILIHSVNGPHVLTGRHPRRCRAQLLIFEEVLPADVPISTSLLTRSRRRCTPLCYGPCLPAM